MKKVFCSHFHFQHQVSAFTNSIKIQFLSLSCFLFCLQRIYYLNMFLSSLLLFLSYSSPIHLWSICAGLLSFLFFFHLFCCSLSLFLLYLLGGMIVFFFHPFWPLSLFSITHSIIIFVLFPITASET